MKRISFVCLIWFVTAVLLGSGLDAEINASGDPDVTAQFTEANCKYIADDDVDDDTNTREDLIGVYVQKTDENLVFTMVYQENPSFIKTSVSGFTIFLDTDRNRDTGYYYEGYGIEGADVRIRKNGQIQYFKGEDRSDYRNWKLTGESGRQLNPIQFDGKYYYVRLVVPITALELNDDSTFDLSVLSFDQQYKARDLVPARNKTVAVTLADLEPRPEPESRYNIANHFTHYADQDNIPRSTEPYRYGAFSSDDQYLDLETWQGDFTLMQDLDGPTQNLLPNCGFEEGSDNTLKGWTVEYVDGAEGRVEWDCSYAKSGQASLKIVKENAAGYIVVSSTMPVADLPYEQLILQGYYHTYDAKPAYTMAPLRIDNEDSLVYRKVYGNAVGKLMKMINMPEGRWDKSTVNHTDIDLKNKTVTVRIYCMGDPHTIWWDDFCLESYPDFQQRFLATLEQTDYQPELKPLAEIDQALKQEPEHTARLVRKEDIPQLYIDEQPALPFIYKDAPHNRVGYTGGLFAKYGTNLHAVHLDLRDNVWTSNGQFNPEPALEKIRIALQAAPDAKLILMMGVYPYRDFVKDHPEAVWMNAKGEPAWGSSIHLEGFGEMPNPTRRYWASYFSEEFQQQALEAMLQIVNLLKETGYSKRVVGIHVGGGHDGQWAIRRLDYSPSALIAFKQWLRDKYQTDEALATAWRQPGLTFDQVSCPQPPLAVNGRYGTFYDPTRDQPFVDYYHFIKWAPDQIQNYFSGKLEQAMGKPLLFGRGCMGAYGGDMHSATDLEHFVQSEHLDYIMGFADYRSRLPGYPMKYKYPLTSYILNGKIYMAETDLRTYNTGNGCFRRELYGPGYSSKAQTFKVWQVTFRKCMAEVIAQQQATWVFDIGGAEYQDEKIQQDIAEVREFYQKLYDGKKNWRPDVVLVHDETSMFWTQVASHRWMFLPKANNELIPEIVNRSGVPFDTILFSDLEKHPETHGYKIYVFLNLQYVDSQRAELLEKLKSGGRSLVWISGSGYLNEHGASLENIEKVTGFQAHYHPERSDQSILPTASDDTTIHLNGQQSAAHLMDYSLHLGSPTDPLHNTYHRMSRFSVAPSPEVKMLAHYESDGEGAIAYREMDAYRSVFIGGASALTPELLHDLAEQAEAYTVSQPGIEVVMNDRFMSIHCIIPGSYRIQLPRTCDVVNLYNGQIIARNTDALHLNVHAQSIYWLELK